MGRLRPLQRLVEERRDGAIPVMEYSVRFGDELVPKKWPDELIPFERRRRAVSSLPASTSGTAGAWRRRCRAPVNEVVT